MTDSIQTLDEVTLSDVKLKRYNSGYKIATLNDSIINKSAQSLTSLLAVNSNIYFKEFGFGMLSSPSFRGTNASQTAVVWNGININSQLNGQTDFNNEIASNYSSISIRSGGGSVQYGSGAIGGSVHLNNKLKFTNHFENSLRTTYGSFETSTINYLLSTGNHNWTTTIGLSRINSKNDYKFLGTDRRNENGAYNKQNLTANFGYFISKSNVLRFYHNTTFNDRNLSGTLVFPSKSNYKEDKYRSLLEWTHLKTRLNSKLKLAYLQEVYNYLENKDSPNIFSFGKASSLIAQHGLDYKLSKAISVNSIIDYTAIKGEGSSFGQPSRAIFSTTLLWKHTVTDAFNYGLNLRKDFTSNFKSPVIISGDLRYNLFSFYTIKANASKNFRVPTFNDLFWQDGGNSNLKPETSYQFDLGQIVRFKPIEISANAYYIKTSDMIQWRPDTTGTWSPINIGNVEAYGVELGLNSQYKYRSHLFKLTSNYNYTISKDLEKEKQLIYVPIHKVNANFAYYFNNFSMYYQHLINGAVYIIGGTLKGYDFGTIGLGYDYKISPNYSYKLNLNVNNIYNTYYENVALRPMPNRNYQIQLTIKF